MTLPNGNTYNGTFGSGVPDGQGTFTWTGTGEHLDAQFEKGDPKHGTYYWKDGKTLTGDLKEGKFLGPVVMKLPDGSKYEGDWSNGKPQGHGTLRLTASPQDDSLYAITLHSKADMLKRQSCLRPCWL